MLVFCVSPESLIHSFVDKESGNLWKENYQQIIPPLAAFTFMLFIYLFSNFFQDMKVYISENEFFSDFSDGDRIFWEYDNIEYGDWTSGPNGDGSLTFTDVIPATQVC